MQYEFDQLLEALWDGRLDDEGRRRLDEMCAADPRLAARYRQERKLTGLLTRCGPNYAPDDLARSVMARLETRVRIRPVRPWYWWAMAPAFRTAFAAVVLVALGIQIGVLISNNRDAQVALAPISPPTPTSVELTRRPPEVPDPDSRTASRVPSTNSGERSSSRRLQAGEPARQRTQPAEPMIAMNNRMAPAPQPNYRLEPLPTPVATPTPAMPEGLGEFPSTVQPAVPATVPAVEPTATPKPAIPEVRIPPETRVAREQAPPLGLSGRDVVMQITLNPNALQPPSVRDMDTESHGNPLPPSAHAFVPRVDAKPRQTPLTHKEVESELFAVPDVETKDADLGAVPGQPRKWQVRVELTPAQLRSFVERLNKKGIESASASRAGGKEESDALRNQPMAQARNFYDLTQGRQWLQSNPMAKSLKPAAQPAGTSSTVNAATGQGGNAAEEKLNVKIIIEHVDGLLSTR